MQGFSQPKNSTRIERAWRENIADLTLWRSPGPELTFPGAMPPNELVEEISGSSRGTTRTILYCSGKSPLVIISSNCFYKLRS